MLSIGKDHFPSMTIGKDIRSVGNPMRYAAQYDLLAWFYADLGITTNDPVVLSPDAFDNAAWVKTNVSVFADAGPDPTGGSAADLVVDDATAGEHRLSQTVSTGFVASRPSAISVDLLDGGTGWAAISGNSATNIAWFNLATGTLGTVSGAGSSATISALGGGWYRCSLRYTPVIGSFRIYVTNADGVTSYSGSGNGIYAFRAVMTQPKVSQWSDQSGLGNHAEQLTATRQPLYSDNGFGGYSAIDMGTAGGAGILGLQIPSITLGTFTIMMAGRFETPTEQIYTHVNNVTPGSWMYGSPDPGSRVMRGIEESTKATEAGWLRNGVRQTVTQTFDGTKAGHVVYRNTTNVVSGNGIGTTAGEPGISTVVGSFYVGNRQTFTNGMRGLLRELLVFGKPVPASVQGALHRGVVARCPGAI